MGPAPTAHVETVDSVMLLIIGISLLLLIGVTVTMVYFVFKYNRKKGHKPVDIHGSFTLESLFIGVPTILVMVMFYYGYTGYRDYREIPDDAMEVDVVARMWEWSFNYGNGKKTDTLYVPVGKHVKLNLRSVDVNHSFYIPAFRIKEDAIAGKLNVLGFKAEKEGSYDVACAEYCGLNHSMMYTKVVAMDSTKFNIWLNEPQKEEIKTTDDKKQK